MSITFVAVVLVTAVLLTPKQNFSVASLEQASIKDLSTEGFVAVRPTVDVSDGNGLIGLTGGCFRMVAGTETGQAQSIRDGLEDVTGPRPNTHELMRDAFDSLGIKILMVKITELRGNNFFGKLLLQQGNTLLALDAKPSDGIALAIRTGAPIYFNETLLKERGEKIC